MSCDKRCFDPLDPFFGHQECSICPGRDDGSKNKDVLGITAAQLSYKQALCGCYACAIRKYPYILIPTIEVKENANAPE